MVKGSSALAGLRVSVIGGSLGGLSAALFLRRAGAEVHVFERNASPLFSSGAAIVLQPSTLRWFEQSRSQVPDRISIGATAQRYLAFDGTVLKEVENRWRFANWNDLYRELLQAFGFDRYHVDKTLTSIESKEQSVTAVFSDRSTVSSDLLVCADGASSAARRQFLPTVAPRYAGYVGWRGRVRAGALTRTSREQLGDALTYAVMEGSHIVAYPIPGPGRETDEDNRMINFVLYRNVMDGPVLDDLMTDREGVHRPSSLLPGTVQERHVDQLRRDVTRELPAALAELVVTTEQPFIQSIAELEVPAMQYGRACLIGDAAFVARPHAAAGTAKAAENAWTLASALVEADGDVPRALSLWQPGQLELGTRLVARAAAMGERLQSGDPGVGRDGALAFGLFGPNR